MGIRIGIDVGGTFTDAVAIDNSSFELIGSVKVPTTHKAKEGVAAGIIQSLQMLIDECNIESDEVIFIAHGTTQATNALLEGDVEPVGIITLGQGIEGVKARADTVIGEVELAKNKILRTYNAFVNTSRENFTGQVEEAIEKLINEGSVSIVASEAFSVDDPESENFVVQTCTKINVPATASNEVSKLYGLKVRTRTAVINASIMPKMLEAANLTEQSINDANIKAQLMVMRCDGGVMTIDEVRQRPILTILSGPAAGVAGALMYEKLTDGLFLEVGGTSTDISCVKDGNILIKYAEIGGHKTYLSSLDVRTVGIGGGSMVEIANGKAVDVGPRSAHIANLEYEVYADPDDIIDPILKVIHPLPDDPGYAYIECRNGKNYALTLSGAANIAGYVAPGDYAHGNLLAAEKAWKPLAESMKMSVKEMAMKVLEFSSAKNLIVINKFIRDYKLSVDSLTFVGGGGGASTVTPHLAEQLGCKHKIARNAPVISPIGVSLAMVREMVERTVPNATQQDVLSIRTEAFNMAVQSGAQPATVEVDVTVDPRSNVVRAVAIGTTELRTKDLTETEKSTQELRLIVAENLRVDENKVDLETETNDFCVFSTEFVKRIFRVFKVKSRAIRLIDRYGVIRLQRLNAHVVRCSGSNARKEIDRLLREFTMSGEGGDEIPNIYIVIGKRIISLSGMQTAEQVKALSDIELQGVMQDDELLMICTLTTDNERG